MKRLKHGDARIRGKSTLYKRWRGMRCRCAANKGPEFYKYKKRGIRVCQEWDDFTVFKAWAISSGFHENLCLDRIDNNKGYSPDNCRWVTHKQNNNNRRDNIKIEFKGEVRPIGEWCTVLGISVHAVRHRIARGWDHVTALSRPINKYRRQK